MGVCNINNHTPLVSIIVPVYNVSQYLNRCIESLKAQSHQNLEIILINDGSKDNSGKICDNAVQLDSRIKVIHQANGGSSIARNNGIRNSTGEYIAFVDSDDLVEKNYIKDLLDFALENNLKIVECNSIRTTQLDKVDTCFDFSKRIEDREVAMERIIGERLFAVWRRIYHRSLIEDRFFIPYKIHQDVFYTIDTINMVERIGYLDSPLYIYNMGNNDSIIRGKYTQNKLNARDAAMYVIEKTRHSNETIRKNSKKYLVQFLTFHYNNLFLNKELDKDGNIHKTSHG